MFYRGQKDNVTFSVCPVACFFVCEQDYEKNLPAIFVKPSKIMDYSYGMNHCWMNAFGVDPAQMTDWQFPL